jgi:hypothetical protein
MAKSKFFGYVLRNAGTPCQQWVLNELPVSTVTVFTSSTTSSVATSGTIPLSSVTLNQFGGRINSDGSFSLPCGLYKIEFSLIPSTAAAGVAIISLNAGSTTLFTSEVSTAADGVNGTISGSIAGDTVIRSTGCNINFALVNSSTVAITPVMAGTESVRVIITKIA